MNKDKMDLQEAKELNQKSRSNSTSSGINSGDLQEARELNKKSRKSMK